MRKSNCYVCGYSYRSSSAKGLSFHGISQKRSQIHVVNKWLEFLHLPPVSEWPDKSWSCVSLCSLHFIESDYSGRQMFMKKILHNNAVPTQLRPNGPGLFGKLFSDVKIFQRDEQQIEEDMWQDEPELSDPAILDHDYIGTEKSIKQEHFGDPKENVTTLHSQLLLEKIRKELCRLCGQKGLLLKPIFDETDEIISLSTKIAMYLPFKVKVDDPIPGYICSQCFEVLNRWHELYITSVANDAVLWKTFGRENYVSVRNLDFSTNRHQENDYQCVNQINMECHEDISPVAANEAGGDIEALNEVKAEPEILCSVCGMNTSSKPVKEEDAVIKEFENFYSHVNSFKYKCNYCFEFFLNSRAKKEHLKNCRELHTICEICGKSDVHRKNLRRHKYSSHHSVVRTRVCDRCGLCFKSLYAFNKHVLIAHGQGLVPKVYCKLCCTAFFNEQNYRNHLKKHEEKIINTEIRFEKYLQNEGVCTCPVCDEIFSDSLSLVVHLTSKKKLKCPTCHKLITSEKKFMLHVCSEWNCRYCSKTFKNKIQWSIHERLHTGERPMKCRICGKSFRSWTHRGRHETIHRPAFQCSVCDKRFKTKHIFEDHVKRHEGKVFGCLICEKQFSGRQNLGKHMTLFHKKC